LLSPNYQPGDLILLDAWNWKTRCPSQKVDSKWHGPFKVLAKVSPYTYQIKLPPTIKCDNIHYISLLEPTANNPDPCQWPNPPPLVDINGEDEYFIEAILDSQIHHSNLQYLVKWIGYYIPDSEPAEFPSESKVVD
jgi:hypothetical protein